MERSRYQSPHMFLLTRLQPACRFRKTEEGIQALDSTHQRIYAKSESLSSKPKEVQFYQK